MRVTRNYRDGMVNFKKTSKNSQMSLLQSALSRNSSSSRANRLASLLGFCHFICEVPEILF